MTGDSWVHAPGKTLSSERIERLARELASGEPLLVEHRYYQGAGNSRSFICEDADELRRYLEVAVQPGDSLHFWKLSDCCTNDNVLDAGLVPDSLGRTPARPAY